MQFTGMHLTRSSPKASSSPRPTRVLITGWGSFISHTNFSAGRSRWPVWEQKAPKRQRIRRVCASSLSVLFLSRAATVGVVPRRKSAQSAGTVASSILAPSRKVASRVATSNPKSSSSFSRRLATCSASGKPSNARQSSRQASMFRDTTIGAKI